MKKFLFARHGQSVGNAQGLLQGDADYPLTSLGMKDAEKLANRIMKTEHGITKIISSDLKRCVETATVVAGILNLPVETSVLLREVSFGSLQDQKITDIQQIVGSEDINKWLMFASDAEPKISIKYRIKKTLENLEGGELLISHGIFGAYLVQEITGSNNPDFDLFRTNQGEFLSFYLPQKTSNSNLTTLDSTQEKATQ